MQFRLRTLLIVLALGPVVLAGAWFVVMELSEQLNSKAALPLPKATQGKPNEGDFRPGDIE